MSAQWLPVKEHAVRERERDREIGRHRDRESESHRVCVGAVGPEEKGALTSTL